ncbi:hypothetical protein GCM10027452_07790 [Micromonospora halotolerans]
MRECLVAVSLSILRDEGEQVRRVSYDEYLLAVALTLARRHRPVWSWRHWRRVCRCGADLPCRSRHLIPINRGHWPSQDDPR